MPMLVQNVPDSSTHTYLLVVRRECQDKLAFLQDAFATRPSVCVIPDRRQHDRRRAVQPSVNVERRRRDRRAPAMPPSWDISDYVLVPVRQP
jgi:hypothetical protein